MLNAHKSYGIDYCNSFFFFISFKWIVQFNFRCSVVCLLPSKPGTIYKICCDGRLYCHVIALRRRCRGTLKHSLFFIKQNFIVALWLFVYHSFTNVIWLPISIVVGFQLTFSSIIWIVLYFRCKPVAFSGFSCTCI